MTATLENRNAKRQQWDDSARSSLRVRQKFDNTDRPTGYILPRQTASSDVRTSQSSDEVPFDLLNEVRHVRDPVAGRVQRMESISSIDRSGDQEFSFESVWESSPERMKTRIAKNRTGQPHFALRGPRYSDPSIMGVSRVENQDAQDHVNSSERRKHYGVAMQPTNYQEISVQPLAKVDEEHPDYDERLNQRGSRLHDKRISVDSNDVADEVAVQFPEKGRKPAKMTHKVRRRSPSHLRDLSREEADDTSQESTGQKRRSPNTLQERTQQAWKWRQKKNSSLRSPDRDPAVPRASNNVSFRGADTVQYFDPHIDEATDETVVSFDEKSLNSEYTKTLESEVEDMIKDIFFIGSGKANNPGRRKYKYKHEVKKRLREKGLGEILDASDDDIVTASRIRGSRITAESETKRAVEKPAIKLAVKKGMKVAPKKQTEKRTSVATEKKNTKRTEISAPKQTLNDLTETEAKIWGYVDSGFTALSSALGLIPEETGASNATSQAKTRHSNGVCSGPILPFEACPGRTNTDEMVEKRGLTKVFDSAQDSMYGQYRDAIKGNEKSSSSESTKGSLHSLPVNKEIHSETSKEPTEDRKYLPFLLERLDEDPRMEQLALYAAKSLHQAQGVEFDDSYPISLHDDLQVSVVELKLPLGLIFLENEGGCFVTKVVPGGSAARSNGVEIGDQLAAINGESFARMKVDDICDMIARSSTRKSVELVFLRYIGAFRPCRNSQDVSNKAPSFDLDMTNCSMTIQPVGRPPSGHHVSKTIEDQGRKKGFRIFGLGKKKDGSKK